MPSTHLSLHYHLVFSTKERYPYIDREWRDRLHAYLGGCLNATGAIPERIGGTDDHVHLLTGLKATHRLSDVLREIKQASSEWVHNELGVKSFGWQEGYGAFTVGSSHVAAVRTYIEGQEEYHRRRTFQEEYREFLARNDIAFDERFLW